MINPTKENFMILRETCLENSSTQICISYFMMVHCLVILILDEYTLPSELYASSSWEGTMYYYYLSLCI